EEDAATIVINDYFDAMTRIAHTKGGTLDKFVGDGMMVFFGDPTSKGREADALACVTMAAEMQAAAACLARRHKLSLEVRMGVHSGFCLVGSFGTRMRRDYTAFGSVVNIASRLEGKAKPGEILMSVETGGLIQGAVTARPGALLKLKGIVNPVATCSYVGEGAAAENESAVAESEIAAAEQAQPSAAA
ncbi:MAG: adenylate/guanylate cyclase domain-containing protein, partial [Pseudomonadales bacterium]